MSNAIAVLGERALREAKRTPDALLPTLLIPLFFLVVNVGQVAKVFPASTPFLEGQGYAAFQLPSSLLLAASFGTSALYLVEEIEGGYFDKLRATPVHRSSLVLGRLVAVAVQSVLMTTVLVAVSLLFNVRIASGVFGFLLLVVLAALLGDRLRRIPAVRGAEDAQRGGHQLRRPGVLPAALPHAELRAARAALPADGDRRHLQPGDLRRRGDAVAGAGRVRLAGGRAGLRGGGAFVVAMVALNVRTMSHYD